VFADFVDGADVGVVEGRGGAGFAAEAFEGERVTREIFGEKFQGDEAAEVSVFGFVDDTHASAAEFFEDAVAGDFFTEEALGVRHVALMVEEILRLGKRGKRRVVGQFLKLVHYQEEKKISTQRTQRGHRGHGEETREERRFCGFRW
jgi:hypothetical protein